MLSSMISFREHTKVAKFAPESSVWSFNIFEYVFKPLELRQYHQLHSNIQTSNMKSQTVVCVLVCVSVAFAASPSWKKCPAADANVEECLKGAIQDAIKELGHGSSMGFTDLKGVKQDKISIIDTATGPFRGKLIYNDVTLDGFEATEVKKVEKQPGGVLRVEFFLPKTALHGKYIMDTVLLAVPMKGNGDVSLNTEKFSVTLDFTIKKKQIGGITAYNVESITSPAFNVEYLQIHHTNLFNGNKALGDNVNKILNEQWKTLTKELGPITVKAFNPVFLKLSNNVLNKLSADEFPLPL